MEQAVEITSRERFLRTLRNERVDRPPVWLMRQAGRYMPEYMAIKEKHNFAEMCRTPDIAAEISLLPHRAFNPDAVIVFNDILIPLEPMGTTILYGENGGPRIESPVREARDVHALSVPEFDSSDPVAQTIAMLRETLGDEQTILGFAGAPFTMVSYLVEKQMTRELTQTRRFMYEEPALFDTLLDKVTDTVIRYLRIQIEAGADAVQLFDTWAGILPPGQYVERAYPYQKRIVDSIRAMGTPVILFVNGSSGVLPYLVETGADAVSVDWRVRLDGVRQQLGPEVVLQGNLDPMALFAPPAVLQQEIESLLRQVDPCRGYIFNLGHGILPGTPYDNVRLLFETVREKSYASV